MNFQRDMFPVDLGVDLSALQPEITQCKRRFQQDLWNIICNRVLQGQSGWKKEGGGKEASKDSKTKSEEKPDKTEEGGETKEEEPPKEEEENKPEESGENENNYAGNWSNSGRLLPQSSRGRYPAPPPQTWGDQGGYAMRGVGRLLPLALPPPPPLQRQFNRNSHQPQYQPQHQPRRQPQIQPQYQPQHQPQYQPQHQPRRQPQNQPQYQPQHKPQYQPQYQPQYHPQNQSQNQMQRQPHNQPQYQQQRQPQQRQPQQHQPQHQQQRVPPGDGELSQFLSRIQPQEGVLDWRDGARPHRTAANPQHPQQQPQQQAHPVTNPSHARSFSATSRREILGCFHEQADLDETVEVSEAFEDAQIFCASGWSHGDADSGGLATNCANDGATDSTVASRQFVPLIAGNWFAARRPEKRH